MATKETNSKLQDIAKRLNKEYSNNNLIIKADVVPYYNRLASGLMGFDYALWGGLTTGRVHVFSGLEHSGKTLASMAFLAAYQREHPDKICVFVDVERSLDLKFQAVMNHIDPERLYYFCPDGMSGEQVLEAILELQDAEDIGLIILDSVPALQSASDLENDFTKDNGMRSTIAKSMQKFLKAMCDKLHQKDNILILINQVRIAGYTYNNLPIYKEPGGSYISYAASSKVRFGTRVFLKDGEELKGGDGEGATGFRLKFKITKNKTASPTRGGGYASFNYVTGAEYVNDMISVALQFGFIQRINNVTYALVNLETGEIITDSETGEELKNKKAYLINYINTHENFRNKYMAMLKQYITAANDISLLDKEAAAEIDAQENALEKVETEDNGENSSTRQTLLESAE